MAQWPYLTFTPQLGERVYLAPGVQLIGRAQLGNHVSVWHNCVIRADVNVISIGHETNIQDLSMLHVTEENALTIGAQVSIGHSVVMHGCRIGNNCLIGMGSIILDGAVVGDNCLVAAGSLLPPGKKYPAGHLIRGRPAVAERPLNPDELTRYGNHYRSYLKYKETYLAQESATKA